ncbi:uncharacterized protein [Dysidea avara]|uniref:uncharacterized protein isoform X2 n=1 Tax=Dysidea avara TaxID=196820 RepID=UPI003331D257
MADNPILAAFEKHYKNLTIALPAVAMYPTFVGKGLMSGTQLNQNFRAAKTNMEKTVLLLESMRGGLMVGEFTDFLKFVEAMTEYAESDNSPVVRKLAKDIKNDLPRLPPESTAEDVDKRDKRKSDNQGELAAKKMKHDPSLVQGSSSSSFAINKQEHDDVQQGTVGDDRETTLKNSTDLKDQPAKLELFISYGREDITNDFVQKLRDDLKYQNWNVFLDTHNIDHAESLSDKLAKEISKSDGMIIILSKKSCKSKWCEREVKYADQENKKIFVVKREDIDPPPYLKFILGDDLWFSLYDDDQEQYQSVLEKMIRTLKKLEQSKNEH